MGSQLLWAHFYGKAHVNGCFSQIVYRGKEYSNFKIIKEAGIIKIID